jgi:fibrillarin-like pre-rRNA processing protein
MIKLKPYRFQNIYLIDNKLCTKNSVPGNQIYGETLFSIKGVEFREWSPHRSKLAALIMKGCENLPIKPGCQILYLGAANGTTASHISDIIEHGQMHCIEFSVRSFKDLLKISNSRKNILPILEDAFHPERYKQFVGKVDIVYQDISQREQIRAFTINVNNFLKPGGFGIFMVKSRSIDITKSPSYIFKKVFLELKNEGYEILEQIELNPYSKDHMGIILRVN